MKSIRELYRIGTGPSSSHTMGPRKAAEIFLGKHPEARKLAGNVSIHERKDFSQHLFCSLAAPACDGRHHFRCLFLRSSRGGSFFPHWTDHADYLGGTPSP